MNYNAISGNASRLRHSPNSNRALLRLSAIIPRTVSPAALCLFCFLERNQEVPDRAVSGCSVSRRG